MWGKNEADGQRPQTQPIVTVSRQDFQIDRMFDAVDLDLFSAAHCEGSVRVVKSALRVRNTHTHTHTHTHTANRVDGLNLN